jgi:hypothetical protein
VASANDKNLGLPEYFGGQERQLSYKGGRFGEESGKKISGG